MGCTMQTEQMKEIHSNMNNIGHNQLSCGVKEYEAQETMILKLQHRWKQKSGRYTIYDCNFPDAKYIFQSCNHSRFAQNICIKIRDNKLHLIGSIETSNRSCVSCINGNKWDIKNSKGRRIGVVVAGSAHICPQSKCKFYIKSVNEMDIYYTIEGTFWKHEFIVRDTDGACVAKSGQQLISCGYHSYGMEISQGIDYVVISMIMIAIDQYGLANAIMYL